MIPRAPLLLRCVALVAIAAAALGAAVGAGAPPVLLLVLGSVLVCVIAHVAMASGDAEGRDLLETARRAARGRPR